MNKKCKCGGTLTKWHSGQSKDEKTIVWKCGRCDKITTQRKRKPYTLETTKDIIESTIGIESIALIHANDSLGELNSFRDRHEHIGKGHIGLQAFRLLMNDKRLKKIPKILETPKGPDMKEDRENIKILLKLCK